MIKVVLFDLDDTLFAHRRAVEDGVVAHLRAIGLLEAIAANADGSVAAAGADSSVAALEAQRWSALEEEHYTRYLRGELDYLGQRRARATDFLAPYGVTFESDAAAEEWFERYLTEYRAAWKLHDDALPALRALGEGGYRLGIITNGVTHFQQPKLDALGITQFFEHVITSGDFGQVKPHPSIFLHACDVFGVAPADAAYVGDRLHTDAIGASNAGLLGIWLDRGATADEQSKAVATEQTAAASADHAHASAASVRTITSLADLPAALSA